MGSGSIIIFIFPLTMWSEIALVSWAQPLKGGALSSPFATYPSLILCRYSCTFGLTVRLLQSLDDPSPGFSSRPSGDLLRYIISFRVDSILKGLRRPGQESKWEVTIVELVPHCKLPKKWRSTHTYYSK